MVCIDRGIKGKLRLLADCLSELHKFGKKLGLNTFRPSPPEIVPHYLMPKSMVKQAIKNGAVDEADMAIEMREWWRLLLARRIRKKGK